jgi:tetratricopeptide (TPR) repeat protein
MNYLNMLMRKWNVDKTETKITVYREMALTLNAMEINETAWSKIQLAIHEEKKLLAEGREDADSHLENIRTRAIVSFQLGRYKEAIKDFNEAINLTRKLIAEGKVWIEIDLVKDYLNRGTSLASMKLYEQAIEDFSQLLDILSRKAIEDDISDSMYCAESYGRRAESYMNLEEFFLANIDALKSLEIMKSMLEIQFIGPNTLLKQFCFCVEINTKALLKDKDRQENKSILKSLCLETLPIVEKSDLNEEAIYWLRTAMRMLNALKSYFSASEWNVINNWLNQINTKLERKETKTDPKFQKAGRNEPCPCGSRKKYKNCCGKNQ